MSEAIAEVKESKDAKADLPPLPFYPKLADVQELFLALDPKDPPIPDILLNLEKIKHKSEGKDEEKSRTDLRAQLAQLMQPAPLGLDDRKKRKLQVLARFTLWALARIYPKNTKMLSGKELNLDDRYTIFTLEGDCFNLHELERRHNKKSHQYSHPREGLIKTLINPVTKKLFDDRDVVHIMVIAKISGVEFQDLASLGGVYEQGFDIATSRNLLESVGLLTWGNYLSLVASVDGVSESKPLTAALSCLQLTRLLTEKNYLKLLQHIDQIEELAVGLLALQQAGLLYPPMGQKNFDALLANKGMGYALSPLQKAGLLTQPNFDALLLQAKYIEDLEMMLDFLTPDKDGVGEDLLNQDNFDALLTHAPHEMGDMTGQVRRSGLLTQPNFNKLLAKVQYANDLKDVLSHLVPDENGVGLLFLNQQIFDALLDRAPYAKDLAKALDALTPTEGQKGENLLNQANIIALLTQAPHLHRLAPKLTLARQEDTLNQERFNAMLLRAARPQQSGPGLPIEDFFIAREGKKENKKRQARSNSSPAAFAAPESNQENHFKRAKT